MKKRLFAFLLILCMAIAITLPALADDSKNVTVFIQTGDYALTVVTFAPEGDHNNLPNDARFGKIEVTYQANYAAKLNVKFDRILKNGVGAITGNFVVHDMNNAPLNGDGNENIPLSASPESTVILPVFLVGAAPQTLGRHTGLVTIVIGAAS